ncbi:MAG TPA: VWA domain-containing protein [Thermoanaerobaculia bacterium]|nr:VWA domain-containing protein [Thermoanaerobaculia bacterium]
MRNARWSRLAGIAWIACAAAAGAQGQSQGTATQTTVSTEPLPVVGEVIDVRVVNVEVVATDKRGKRVTGLKPEELRLKVDGKPVPIEYFTEVSDGRAVATAAAAGPGAAAPEAPAAPGVEPGSAIGNRYLVFIDDLFSIQKQRNDVLKALKKDLSRLGPQDSMSIVAWEGGRLERISPWSSSRDEIGAALDRAMARPTKGLGEQLRLKRVLEDDKFLAEAFWAQDSRVNDTVDPVLDNLIGVTPGLSLAETAYGATLAQQIGNASLAVASAMRGSGAAPGRKVLLLLAGGWPFTIEGYVHAGRPVTLAQALPLTMLSLHALADTANLLGYTIYPIDVPGITAVLGDIRDNPLEAHTGAFAPANPLRAETPTSTTVNPPLSPYPSTLTRIGGTRRDQELEATLQYLARETGGRPLLNGNRTLGLANAQEDTRSYYWLGFTPAWQRDSHNHRIEVEVLRKGVEVRARRGYLDLSPRAEMMMKVESALLFGDLPEAEPLAIHLGTPARKARITEIPLTLDIPASVLTMVPDQGRYTGQAELCLAALDEQGNQSTVPRVPLRLVSPRQPGAGSKMRYETRISLRGRANRLVAMIYDPLSGRIAAGRVDMAMP